MFTRQRTFLFILGFLFISCATLPRQELKNEPLPKQVEEKSEVNPDALQRFMDGQFYMSEGNYAMAVLEFQDALVIDPKVSTIHISLGESYWHLGKTEHSEYHLKKAISLDSTDTEPRELLAGQYLMRKQFDFARDQFLSLRTLDAENIDYILALADIAKIEKQFEEAVILYREAYEINSDASHALEAAVEIYLNQKKYKSAQDIISTLISENPKNVHYKQALAEIAVLNGDLEIALESLQKIISIQGANPEVLSQIGLLHYELKNTEAALEVFLDVVDIDSTHQSALHSLSTIFREQENSKDSKYFAEKMIAVDSLDPSGYVNAALAAMLEDDYLYVIALLSEVSQRFIEDYTIQYLLGVAYELEKKYENALPYLEQALHLWPESRNALHTLAIVYDNTERWSQSDSAYTQLIETDSTDAQAYNNYAYSLIERDGNPELAKSLSKRAITLEPESAAYLDTYGWICFKLNDVDSALYYIRRSVEIEETNAEVLEHLGDVLLILGQDEEAISYFKKALQYDPNNIELIEKISHD